MRNFGLCLNGWIEMQAWCTIYLDDTEKRLPWLPMNDEPTFLLSWSNHWGSLDDVWPTQTIHILGRSITTDHYPWHPCRLACPDGHISQYHNVTVYTCRHPFPIGWTYHKVTVPVNHLGHTVTLSRCPGWWSRQWVVHRGFSHLI